MSVPGRAITSNNHLVRESSGAFRELWLSSGTASLIAALEAIEVRERWVAVPPNVCPNVIAAIYCAGGRPWFVDIEATRQGMDPALLSTVISRVAAVVAVHAYGVPCRIDEIAEVSRHGSVPLVEDCAQADGASLHGKQVGEFGDIAVFSFGTGKIVDAGGGGFAATASSGWYARLTEVTSQWPVGTHELAARDLGDAYRYFYNRFYPERTAVCQAAFDSLVRALAPAFVGKIDPLRVDQIRRIRERLSSLVETRLEKCRKYATHFRTHDCIESLVPPVGSAPWRFNLLLPESIRDNLLRRMLAEGLNVSSWYPDITRFLPREDYASTSLDAARHFDRRILNLWIDDETPTNLVQDYAARVILEVSKHDAMLTQKPRVESSP